MCFSWKNSATTNGRGEGYKYPSPKTSHWAVKFRNLRKICGDSKPKKLAVRFKTGPETPLKYPESPDKVSICLFLFSGISGIFGVSAGLPDSLGDLRENTITFYSGLRIR
jgi:hypothetical protein